MYHLLFAARAQREAMQADEWWRANREEAPMLFASELGAAMEKLSRTPLVGARLNHPWRDLRRWLLPRCRYAIYYSVDTTNHTITIRSLWHTSRRQLLPR
jgi:hypothetical protein